MKVVECATITDVRSVLEVCRFGGHCGLMCCMGLLMDKMWLNVWEC